GGSPLAEITLMAQVTLEEVTRLADQLSAEEQRVLAEHLSSQPQMVDDQAPTDASTCAERPLQSLRGIWQGHFPEDFDIDAVLYEIRHEWEKEWPELIAES